MRLLVVGGSDAGIAAAVRARELAPSVEATVVVADAFPNFSICGLPYYLSGDVGDWRDLAHRTTTDLEQAGLQLLLDHTAQSIDPASKQVTITSQHGERQLGYDRLVIGTGAVPVRPPIDGLDLPGVHVLHTMGDTFALHQALTAGARSAVIVGGGYLGLEMAEAFTSRGLEVTLVEQAPAVMSTVDLELGRLLGEELGRHGVQVVNDVTVKAIHQDTGGLTVAGEPDFAATADLVLVVVGVRPDTDLAVAAGVQTGVRGRCGSTAACAPTSPTCWPPGTAWRPGIGCSRRPPTCRLGPPPTSRAGSPARPPSVGIGSLPARWGPRWSRCSSWPWPAPAWAIRKPPPQGSTR
jgi:NADPH-dependent 2,4-dienoyl-CoA reductase/sulfur reductase-like enzyme